VALLHATQLYSGTITSTAPVYPTLFTVPAGERYIVRSAVMRNLLAANQQIVLIANGLAVFTIVLTSGGAAGGSFEWTPWLVMTPGQTMQAHGASATGFNLIVSGSHYTI
jgi:hypothetical protein